MTGHHIKPAIANLSLFLSGGSQTVDKAVRQSMAAGVTYIVIAGNKPSFQPPQDAGNGSPARVTGAITVGATGSDSSPFISDTRASFSNFGSVLDLFAPGTGIPSAASTSDTATTTNSGTSLAAPHVTGAVAQYLQLDPTACPCTASNVITETALSRVGNPGANTTDKLLFIPAAWASPTYFSLSLNGTSAYVDVPNTPAGSGVAIDIAGPITVEAWVNTSSTFRQGIVERYNNSACTGTADGGYALLIRANGNVRFQTLKNGCEYVTLDALGVNVRDGMWHHIAAVFDGSEMRIYVDGQRKAFMSSNIAPGAGTSHLLIGRSQDGAGFFNGLIDEVRVTAGALYIGVSFNHLALNHLTGVLDTKGLWRFDKQTTQTTQDCARVNDGTLVGGPTFSTSVP